MKKQWRIYYADDSTYEGDPELAPPFGVIDIIQWNDSAEKRYHTQGDYYVYNKKDDSWVGVDLCGLIDHLAHDGFSLIRMGRTIPTAKFWEIYNKARTDDF